MSKKVLFNLTLIVVTVLLVACAQNTQVQTEKDDTILIGYSAPSLVGGQERLVNMIMDSVKSRGWQMVVTTSGGNPQKQNDDIDYLISLGADAIIANPDDSSAICAAVEKANEAKVPFFTADRSPSGCAIAMTVLSDNRMAGSQAGEVMVDAIQKKYGEPKGKVLEITGNLGQNVGQLRRDGFHDVLDKYPNVEVIQKVADWDAAKAQQIVRDVLNANPDLDGIYMHSEVVYGPGTEAVLKELNRWEKVGEDGHIILTAVDGGPWLLQTIWDGYGEGIGSQPSSYFPIVVEFVDKAIKGEQIPEGSYEKADALWSPARIVKNTDGTMEMLLGTLKVTADNIKDPKSWSYWNSDLKPPE